jgi:hypothetical protein
MPRTRSDADTLSGDEQSVFVVTIDIEEASSEAVVVYADDESHAKRRVIAWLKSIDFDKLAGVSFKVREYEAVHVLKEEGR